MVTDAAGNIIEKFAYGTYGELLSNGKNKIRFLYNGAYGVATDENGLYYMRARYYNSDIKRFINQDIKVGDIGSSQSLNRYAYCEGNPVSYVDPFGLSPEGTQDQGKESKYAFWHGVLDAAGIFFDGADLINAALYAAEKDYVNAAISLACGIPGVGNIVAGAAKASKAVKAVKAADKIAEVCRSAAKAGNAAAGAKAFYDSYQAAQRECKTTIGKIAYMAGTVITGYMAGKAADWGANKLKNLASNAVPRLKTAVKEGAGKLTSWLGSGIGSSGSGHMNRNRGYAINPFYKGSSQPDLYHYTTKEGAEAIKATGIIKPDDRGRVFVTTDQISADDVNNALMMGQKPEAGGYVVEITLKDKGDYRLTTQGVTQPNELIYNGAIRNNRNAIIKCSCVKI